MVNRRKDRINSLLKEVISDVIRDKVRNPDIHSLLTVTKVEATKDYKNAKVYISVIATEQEKQMTLQALQTAAGFIGVNASKLVVLRFFPVLSFHLDNSVDDHIKINKILTTIQTERDLRNKNASDNDNSIDN
jgi:ribosome-binding factor A